MPAPKAPEFRRRAVELALPPGAIAEIGRNLGIAESCLAMTAVAKRASHCFCTVQL
jgi:transposase-like protein